jgi:hypothetical protein
MTDPRDDLDTWMQAQIKPLPPPPGTFELIRKRARRRKMTRAAVAAAGAAAVIAVIATVPRLVITQLNVGPGPAASGAQVGQTSSAGTHHHQQQSASATPQPTPDTGSPGTVSSAAPPNFAATSVTFVGTATGYLLGQAGTPGHCGPPKPYICTSLAGTDDGGQTWHGVSAPVTGAAKGPNGVSQVRFYNTSDGWAFGPELWATHNGGKSWRQISTGGMRVTALETAGQRVFAVWAQCSGSGANWAAGCTGQTLYSAAPGSDRWAPVPGAAASLNLNGTASAAALMLTSSRGYLLPPSGVLESGPVSNAGGWAPVTGAVVPCLPGAAQADGQPSGALLAAAGTSGLVLVCPDAAAGRVVYTSTDDGHTWQRAGLAPAAGTATSVAGTSTGSIVLASTAGLEVSTDGGATWTAARGALPPGGFSYVGMTTADQGVAVPADTSAHAVWLTYDGGATGHESPIN